MKLVSNNEFPIYIQNRLKWALHCYRWQEGVAWEYYPDTIHEILKLTKKESPLNNRDPYSWIIDGHRPNHRKLRVYEQFIKKVSPELHASLDAKKAETVGGEFIGAFNTGKRFEEEDYKLLSKQAEIIEQYVVFEPKYDGHSPLVYSHGYQKPHLNFVKDRTDDVSMLATMRSFFAFRQIGKTPHLRVYAFGLDDPTLAENVEKYSAAKKEKPDVEWDDFSKFLVDDDTKIKNFNIGIISPDQSGHRYVGMMRNELAQPAQLHMHFGFSDQLLVSSDTPDEAFLNAPVILIKATYFNKRKQWNASYDEFSAGAGKIYEIQKLVEQVRTVIL